MLMKARLDETMNDTVYQRLANSASGRPNDEWLARMLDSWWGGEGALPALLGLSGEAFRELLAWHFDGVVLPELPERPALDPQREPEREELVTLLLAHQAGNDPFSEGWVAQIVAAGCLGNDHLWQDLGLWSRKDLSALIELNFPALKAKNDRDMKWKRFLYKQLCNQEGIYTCRSPSCEVCADYQACFGPEV